MVRRVEPFLKLPLLPIGYLARTVPTQHHPPSTVFVEGQSPTHGVQPVSVSSDSRQDLQVRGGSLKQSTQARTQASVNAFGTPTKASQMPVTNLPLPTCKDDEVPTEDTPNTVICLHQTNNYNSTDEKVTTSMSGIFTHQSIEAMFQVSTFMLR